MKFQIFFFLLPVFVKNGLRKLRFSAKIKKNGEKCEKKFQNVLQIQINVLPLHSQNGKVP